MKNMLSFSICLWFVHFGFSQAPNHFRYQAVARDQNGTVITGQINVRLSFLEDNFNGQNQYSELHSVTTDPQGVFALTINEGTPVSGSFDHIAWGQHEYWLKVELKSSGEATFTDMGVTQFLSVPYAKYAEKSGSDLTAGQGIDISNNIISNKGDISNTNELQTLSVNGNQLAISAGNSVTLPTGTTYNEGSGIQISGNTIYALDASPDNELQNLSVNGNQLSITNGNSVTLPTGTSYTAGSGIQINGNTISATDASTTNEIQTLSINGQQLSLSNGGGSVQLPSGGSSSWTTNSTDIINNPVSNHILIGTSNTSNAKLYVVATGAEEAGHFVSPGTGNALYGYCNGTGAGITASSLNGRGGQFTSVGGAAGYFSSSAGPAIIAESGNVGIGVTNPVRKLQVVGNTYLSNSGGIALEIGAGNVGIGLTAPTHKFEVLGQSFFENNSGAALLVGQGNVGIGTSNPTYKLHLVAGNNNALYISSTNGYGINCVTTGAGTAGRFESVSGPAGYFSSDTGTGVVISQGTYGGTSNSQGMEIKNGINSWRMYVSAGQDLDFTFKNVTKASIWDTDGSYHNYSDIRLKKDIQPFSNVLTRLTKLQAYTYHMKTAAEDSPISLGFMAQEVEAQFPQLVTEVNGLKTLCYDHFAVLSVEAIKEQQVEIDNLNAKVVGLTKEIQDLKAMVIALSQK